MRHFVITILNFIVATSGDLPQCVQIRRKSLVSKDYLTVHIRGIERHILDLRFIGDQRAFGQEVDIENGVQDTSENVPKTWITGETVQNFISWSKTEKLERDWNLEIIFKIEPFSVRFVKH